MSCKQDRSGQLPRAGRQEQGWVVFVLVLVLAVLAGLFWLVGTSSGAAAGLRLAVDLTGSGEVRGVKGSLWQGLSIEHLEYRHPRLDVRADGLHLAVDWPALNERVLRIDALEAGALHLDLRSGEDEPEDKGPAARPQWPELPVAIDLRRVSLGHFSLTQDGAEVPVQVDNLLASLSADAQRAQLQLDSLHVQGPGARADLSGTVRLDAQDPIGVDGALKLDVVQGEYEATLDVGAQGTLEDLALSVVGSGEGMEVDIRAQAAPFSPTLPLSMLSARVKGLDPGAWVQGMPPALLNLTADLRLEGTLFPPPAVPQGSAVSSPATDELPSAQEAGADKAPAAPVAATSLPLDADLVARLQHLRAELKVSIDEGSTWQKQALRGTVDARLEGASLPHVKVDLALGKNTVRVAGSLAGAADQLDFKLDVPQPAALWPGLSGSGAVEGRLRGTIEKHDLAVSGRVDLPRKARAPASGKTPQVKTTAPGENVVVEGDDAVDLPSVLAQGPVNFKLALDGGWGQGSASSDSAPGWRGRLTTLDVRNPQVSAVLRSPLALSVIPGEGDKPLQWSVGETSIRVNLPQRRSFTINHLGSDNRNAKWRSAGNIEGLVPAWLVAQLPRSKNPLQLDADWNLTMTQTLEGTVNLRRRSGDLTLPGQPPIDLGLQTLRLQVRATPANGNSSNIAFDVDIAGSKLGTLSARGTTLATIRDGVPELTEQQAIQVDTSLAIKDLSWLSTFTGDATDIGGAVSGNVRIERTRGVWNTNGRINGSGLRVVRLDDGIRLLDGSLNARLDNGRIVVDRLFFPSVIRSVPDDYRVREWVEKQAAGGSVEASGSWSLEDASGNASVRLTRYPLVQRADRFIAGSGNINIDASPNRLRVEGKVTADLGWISLEGASDLPSLASDVVIVRPGDEAAESKPLPLLLNLAVDLGDRFYLRGMGLDTGLAGAITVRNQRSGMRANGVVTVRDGRFSIYGQTLVVRRGNVTFEGLLDDPLLDIVAVRPNLRIEAGVQVSGTARQPIITLVSYPEVPEVEKLSWLLLGRGPDASGADAGMLLAAAASLLSDEGKEPIYKQLGLDEMGLRSGESSSVRGLLPEQTVVSSVNSMATSDAGTQFLVVGKRLSEAFYLTFEQALSGRESVVRASYRISNTLSAAVQGGTVNGLRLVWSFVFDD